MNAIRTTPMRAETRLWVGDCLDAYAACVETQTRLLETDKMEPMLAKLLGDCAGMALMCAEAMLRGSECRATIARAAAEVTRRCAEDCARFQGDEDLRACASACDRASAACRRIASL